MPVFEPLAPVSTCTRKQAFDDRFIFIGIVVSVIVMAVLLYVRKYDTRD